jgi:hypothetical protein
MFQNAAIDVAIALVLMYLMLSLLCTVINEFIATKLRLRAKSLASALEQLLDNDKLRATFYRHGLIVTNKCAAAIGPQSIWSGITRIASTTARAITTGAGTSHTSNANASDTGTSAVSPVLPPAPVAGKKEAPAPHENHPTYLSSRSVALALIGSLDPTKPLPEIKDIQDAVEKLPASRIRDTLLSSLTEAGGDLDKLRTSIATWFDDSMERLSGAYKRQLKWISMLVGLIVTVVFNADSFNVATTLWGDQASRASVIAIATKVAQESAQTPESIDATKLNEALTKTENTLRSLPIGWNCVGNPTTAAASATPNQMTLGYWECVKTKLPTVTLIQVLGWTLTAIALSLGAPFWFDLLQKFVNIRGAGGKPKREDEKATA